MIRVLTKAFAVVAGVSAVHFSLADTTVIVDSNLSDSYHFVDHYEVLIDRPAEDVWPHLMDFGSWMYQFDMIHTSGARNAEGQVVRLYEGQDFFFEITKIVPGKLIVGVNHPATMQGEEQMGIAMFALTDVGGKTLVSNFMSRYHNWHQESPNPMREVRASEAFQESTRSMWQGFLNRLRELAESD